MSVTKSVTIYINPVPFFLLSLSLSLSSPPSSCRDVYDSRPLMYSMHLRPEFPPLLYLNLHSHHCHQTSILRHQTSLRRHRTRPSWNHLFSLHRSSHISNSIPSSIPWKISTSITFSHSLHTPTQSYLTTFLDRRTLLANWRIFPSLRLTHRCNDSQSSIHYSCGTWTFFLPQRYTSQSMTFCPRYIANYLRECTPPTMPIYHLRRDDVLTTLIFLDVQTFKMSTRGAVRRREELSSWISWLARPTSWVFLVPPMGQTFGSSMSHTHRRSPTLNACTFANLTLYSYPCFWLGSIPRPPTRGRRVILWSLISVLLAAF